MSDSELEYIEPIKKKKTNWVVFTGAPSSGKTTALKILEKKGYKWIPEAARKYIEEELSKGHILEKVRRSESKFQYKILRLKLDIEDKLDPKERIFFDRGIPDSIAYYRLSGLDPLQATKECHIYQYANVFLFECLPLVTDHARIESENEAEKLQEWFEEDYKKLGYEVTHVPVMSVEKRVDLILSKI